MAKSMVLNSTNRSSSLRPAISEEARERQLINLAYNLVEQRLLDGTASSQETTHFLKAASRKTQLEIENLELQKALIEAKTEALQSQKKSEELFREAINAFRNYSGTGDDENEY